MIIKKPEKVCTTINFIDHFLVSASAYTGYISISSFFLFFASLVDILIGATSFVAGI